jgi:hypothetical protein
MLHASPQSSCEVVLLGSLSPPHSSVQ